MDELREGAIPIPHLSLSSSGLSRGYPSSEDRRKRSFRSLVSDLAERLDGDDIKNINWQEEVPPPLREKPALEVLEHLYKRRTFTEYEVRPLARLLKDIHREDLTGRVDAYWEEFGRHYSLPESARHCGIRESGEDRRANTFSVNHVTSNPSQNNGVPLSAIATTEAHQESKAAVLNNIQEGNLHQMSPVQGPQSPRSTHPSQYIQHKHHNSQTLSLEAGNMHGGFCSPLDERHLTSESTPNFYYTPTRESNSICHHNRNRKVSENSIPITLEASSTSSSMCGLPHLRLQSSPQMWLFQSGQSSGNVSEENPLHSSSSCVDAEVSYHKANQTFCNNVSHQKKWYELSSSVTSLPVDQHPGMFRGNSVSRVPPRNLPSDSGKQGGHPMFRSVSQEYYHQSPSVHVLSNFNRRRRHSFVPASKARYAKQCSGGCPVCSPGGGCSHRFSWIPQNGNHSPHLPSCYSCPDHEPHHALPGEISSQQSLPTDHYNMARPPQIVAHCRCTCAPLETPIEHMSGTVSNEMMKNAWSGATCKDPNIDKNFQSQKGMPLTKTFETVDCEKRYNYENNYELPPAADYKQEPHHVITRSNDKPHSAELEREKAPTQGTMYESQSLNRRKQVDNRQATSNSIQSLNHSSISRISKPTYRSRSSSTGNASAVTASNRSLASVNTLTNSITKSPPVEGPLVPRSNGSKDYHPPPSSIHASMPTRSLSTTHVAASISKPWKLFHSSPKPHLIKQDQLVWPVKRDKMNKYIYKKKTKLLTCKLSLDVTSDHSGSLCGPCPRVSIQLHPYGAEEDSNKCVSMKVSIELPKKCQLHSETEIEFQVSARELQKDASILSEAVLGPLQRRRELITRNFFYVKGFITHEALKNSNCDFVEVFVSAKLIMK